jgi:poly-gamma-glutamate synthesis protein (capsule biosynthesis protein)
MKGLEVQIHDRHVEARAPRRCQLLQAGIVLGALLTCALLAAGCSKKSTASGVESGPAVIKMTARSNTISLVSVGDVLLGNAAAPYLETNGYDWPFANVKALLDSADLVVGNLAAPITTRTKKLSSDDDYTYKVAPDSAAALKRAGFHALSLGNNHVLDYGVAVMRETIEALRTNNIAAFGAGDSEDEARRGIIYDFGTVRIGLLSYGDDGSDSKGRAKGARGGYAALSRTNLTQDIARMRTNADVVVVSFHWGKNYKDVTESQQKTGRRAIELGADIVCGHHPHIVQGIEMYQGKPIIYSLGNFVFGTKGKYKDKQGYGLVSRLIFEGKALKWVLATPIAVDNDIVKFQPRKVPPAEAQLALEPQLKRFNTPYRWEGDTAFIAMGADTQTASLPPLPWKPMEAPATNGPTAAGVSVSSNP